MTLAYGIIAVNDKSVEAVKGMTAVLDGEHIEDLIEVGGSARERFRVFGEVNA